MLYFFLSQVWTHMEEMHHYVGHNLDSKSKFHLNEPKQVRISLSVAHSKPVFLIKWKATYPFLQVYFNYCYFHNKIYGSGWNLSIVKHVF